MNKSRWIIATAVLMSALLLSGCATALLGPEKTEDPATASPSASASVDAATVVVAEVNGEAIYKDAYDEAYSNIEMQSMYSGADTKSADAISKMQQQALDSLVNDKIRDQKMEELGYATLTDEEKAKADDDMVQYLLKYIEANSMDAVTANLPDGYTQEDLKAAEVAYVDTLLSDNGMTRADFVGSFQDKVANDKAVAAEKGDLTPSEDEIKAKYDESVAADQKTIQENPTSYVTTVNKGTTVYYIPNGVRHVRHVLISLDTDTAGAISLLRSKGYNAAVDVLLQKGLDAIQEKANDVLKKIDKGEITFEEAITQYNGDPGQTADGYPVMADTTAYQDAFTKGAMGLSAVGEHTGLIATDFGYHIIEYYQDVPAGPIPYDDVKAAISDELKTTKQSEAWDELVAQWKEASNVVTYKENL